MKFIIRDYEDCDLDTVFALATGLPEWFNETGLRHMRIDFHCLKGLVAESGGRVVGFLVYCSDEGIMDIRWIGVDRELHRGGVGRELLARLEEKTRACGVGEIRVETLGDSVEYEPYQRTRAFWRACGFVDVERFMQDDPGWPERLVLHKRVGSL